MSDRPQPPVKVKRRSRASMSEPAQELRSLVLIIKNAFWFNRCEYDKWLLKHIMCPLSLKNHNDPDVYIADASPIHEFLPWELDRPHWRVSESEFIKDHPPIGEVNNVVISPQTRILSVAEKYRMVFIIDLSTSMSTVDSTGRAKVLFSAAFETVCKILDGISRKFTLPNSSKPTTVDPELHVTVIAECGSTSFFRGSNIEASKFTQKFPMRVIFQDVVVNQDNFAFVIEKLYDGLTKYENELVATRRHDKSVSISPSQSEPIIHSSIGNPSDLLTDEPVQLIKSHNSAGSTYDSLEYALLALDLLPKDTMPALVLVTDGVSAGTGSGETKYRGLCMKIATMNVTLTVVQIGSSDGFVPYANYGHVPDNEFLRFIAVATFGTFLYADDCKYLEDESEESNLKANNPPNFYHIHFLFREKLISKNLIQQMQLVHSGSHERHVDLPRARLVVANPANVFGCIEEDNFPWLPTSKPPILDKVLCQAREPNLPVTSLNSLATARLLDGFTLSSIFVDRIPGAPDRIEIVFSLEWLHNVTIEYTFHIERPIESTRPLLSTQSAIKLYSGTPISQVILKPALIEINVLAHLNFAMKFTDAQNVDMKGITVQMMDNKLKKLHQYLKSIALVEKQLRDFSLFNSKDAVNDIPRSTQKMVSALFRLRAKGENPSMSVWEKLHAELTRVSENNYWHFLLHNMLYSPITKVFTSNTDIVLRCYNANQRNNGQENAQIYNLNYSIKLKLPHSALTQVQLFIWDSWCSFALDEFIYIRFISDQNPLLLQRFFSTQPIQNASSSENKTDLKRGTELPEFAVYNGFCILSVIPETDFLYTLQLAFYNVSLDARRVTVNNLRKDLALLTGAANNKSPSQSQSTVGVYIKALRRFVVKYRTENLRNQMNLRRLLLPVPKIGLTTADILPFPNIPFTPEIKKDNSDRLPETQRTIAKLLRDIDQHYVSSAVLRSYMKNFRWVWLTDTASLFHFGQEENVTKVITKNSIDTYHTMYDLIYYQRILEGYYPISEDDHCVTMAKDFQFNSDMTIKGQELKHRKSSIVQYVLYKHNLTKSLVTELWTEPFLGIDLADESSTNIELKRQANNNDITGDSFEEQMHALQGENQLVKSIFSKDIHISKMLQTFDYLVSNITNPCHDKVELPANAHLKINCALVNPQFDLQAVLFTSPFAVTAYRLPSSFNTVSFVERGGGRDASEQIQLKKMSITKDDARANDSQQDKVKSVLNIVMSDEIALETHLESADSLNALPDVSKENLANQNLMESDVLCSIVAHKFFRQELQKFSDNCIVTDGEAEQTDLMLAISEILAAGFHNSKFYGEINELDLINHPHCYIKHINAENFILIILSNYNLSQIAGLGVQKENPSTLQEKRNYVTLTLFECSRVNYKLLDQIHIYHERNDNQNNRRENMLFCPLLIDMYQNYKIQNTEFVLAEGPGLETLSAAEVDVSYSTFHTSSGHANNQRLSIKIKLHESTTDVESLLHVSKFSKQILSEISNLFNVVFSKTIYAALLSQNAVDVTEFKQTMSFLKSKHLFDIDITTYISVRTLLTLKLRTSKNSVLEDFIAENILNDVLAVAFTSVSPYLVGKFDHSNDIDNIYFPTLPSYQSDMNKSIVNGVESDKIAAIFDFADTPCFIQTDCFFRSESKKEQKMAGGSGILNTFEVISEDILDSLNENDDRLKQFNPIGNTFGIQTKLNVQYLYLSNGPNSEDLAPEAVTMGNPNIKSLKKSLQLRLENAILKGLSLLAPYENAGGILDFVDSTLSNRHGVDIVNRVEETEKYSEYQKVELKFVEDNEEGPNIFLCEFKKFINVDGVKSDLQPTYSTNNAVLPLLNFKEINNSYYCVTHPPLLFDSSERQQIEHAQNLTPNENFEGLGIDFSLKSVGQTSSSSLIPDIGLGLIVDQNTVRQSELHTSNYFLSEDVQEFWLVIRINEGCASISLFSQYFDKSRRSSLISEVVKSIVLCLERVNQVILLKDLCESREASIYLIPSHKDSLETQTEDISGIPFGSGEFSCPAVYHHQFLLHPRINYSQALISISRELQSLSIINRENMFVTATQSSIYYFGLFPSNTIDSVNNMTGGIGTNEPQPFNSGGYTPDFSVSAMSPLNSPSVENASNYKKPFETPNLRPSAVLNSLTPRNQSTQAAPQLTFKNTNSIDNVLMLKVYGVDKPDLQSTKSLVELIESTLFELTLHIVSTILIRNASGRLLSQDIDFVLPISKIPPQFDQAAFSFWRPRKSSKVTIKFALPISIKSPICFLSLLRQNMMQQITKFSSNMSAESSGFVQPLPCGDINDNLQENFKSIGVESVNFSNIRNNENRLNHSEYCFFYCCNTTTTPSPLEAFLGSGMCVVTLSAHDIHGNVIESESEDNQLCPEIPSGQHLEECLSISAFKCMENESYNIFQDKENQLHSKCFIILQVWIHGNIVVDNLIQQFNRNFCQSISNYFLEAAMQNLDKFFSNQVHIDKEIDIHRADSSDYIQNRVPFYSFKNDKINNALTNFHHECSEILAHKVNTNNSSTYSALIPISIPEWISRDFMLLCISELFTTHILSPNSPIIIQIMQNNIGERTSLNMSNTQSPAYNFHVENSSQESYVMWIGFQNLEKYVSSDSMKESSQPHALSQAQTRQPDTELKDHQKNCFVSFSIVNSNVCLMVYNVESTLKNVLAKKFINLINWHNTRKHFIEHKFLQYGTSRTILLNSNPIELLWENLFNKFITGERNSKRARQIMYSPTFDKMFVSAVEFIHHYLSLNVDAYRSKLSFQASLDSRDIALKYLTSVQLIMSRQYPFVFNFENGVDQSSELLEKLYQSSELLEKLDKVIIENSTSSAGNVVEESKGLINSLHGEKWYLQLFQIFYNQYVHELQANGFILLSRDKLEGKLNDQNYRPAYIVNRNFNIATETLYFRKQLDKYILVLQIGISHNCISANLFLAPSQIAGESIKHRSEPTRAEIDVFVDLVDLDTFVYDFHVRQYQSILNNSVTPMNGFSVLNCIKAFTSLCPQHHQPFKTKSAAQSGQCGSLSQSISQPVFQYIIKNPRLYGFEPLPLGEDTIGCYLNSTYPIFSSDANEYIELRRTLVVYSDHISRSNYQKVFASGLSSSSPADVSYANKDMTICYTVLVSPIHSQPKSFRIESEKDLLVPYAEKMIQLLINKAVGYYSRDSMWNQLFLWDGHNNKTQEPAAGVLLSGNYSDPDFLAASRIYGAETGSADWVELFLEKIEPISQQITIMDTKIRTILKHPRLPAIKIFDFLRSYFGTLAREVNEEHKSTLESISAKSKHRRHLFIFSPQDTNFMVHVTASSKIPHENDTILAIENEQSLAGFGLLSLIAKHSVGDWLSDQSPRISLFDPQNNREQLGLQKSNNALQVDKQFYSELLNSQTLNLYAVSRDTQENKLQKDHIENVVQAISFWLLTHGLTSL
ncbi:hypothetical protein BJ742DRAFT_396109 [Cladochytrium replicatum]|nr:hypothetical protein BJ742DRAFT_396109 [Cladochytrium replicatum]